METRGKDFMVAMGFCRRVAGDLRVTLDAVEIEAPMPGVRAFAITIKDAAKFMLEVTEALLMLRDISQEAKDFYNENAPDFIDRTGVERTKNPSEEDDFVVVLGTANAIQAEMNKLFMETYELNVAGKEDEATELLLVGFKNIKEMLGMLDFISPAAIKFYEYSKAAT